MEINQLHDVPTVSYEGAWSNPNAVKNLKESFVIKPDAKSCQLPLDHIREVVVEQKLPVNRVGVSASGNTFVHCPNIEVRDNLQQMFSDYPGQTVHPLKDRQPSISIVGITEVFTKEELVVTIQNLNKNVDELMKQGHYFKIFHI